MSELSSSTPGIARKVRVRLLLLGSLFAVTSCKDSSGPEGLPPGTLVMSPGEVRALAAAELQQLRISGGAAGSEYLLVSRFASQSGSLPLQFAPEQIVAPAGPPLARIRRPAHEPELSAASPAGDPAFDGRIRRMERESLTPHIPAARARRLHVPGRVHAPARRNTMPVGTAVQLNTSTRSACDLPDVRNGHVVAVSQFAVVVADDANPAGGFTTADYEDIAAAFDTLVHPVVSQSFGAPLDVDNNGGRSVIFFTRAVNELSPINSSLIVGGFFFSRDLFPTTGTGGCAGSNQAEMFYLLVPDPTGEVNGNVRATATVRRMTVGVLGHEYQHLINASRRIYVNDSNVFEEIWLNEGLSHVAEELLFYRASGLAPRQNITLAMLRESQVRLDAVNMYQVSNLGRLVQYLENTEIASPNTRDDQLSTRGAAWQLLRYAADQSGTPEGTLWFNLANTRASGVANITAVFGQSFETLIRDWSVAQYTDDAGMPVGANHLHRSWNYRSLLAEIAASPEYPLFTRSLATPVSFTLTRGGTAYLRFAVAAGKVGSIAVTSGGEPPPPTGSFVLVRTR